MDELHFLLLLRLLLDTNRRSCAVLELLHALTVNGALLLERDELRL